MTNRKSHMRFQFVPNSMTLNCYKFKFSRNTLHFWEATTAKWMKIDPHCQRRNCCALKVLFNGVQIMYSVTVKNASEGWFSELCPIYQGCRVLTFAVARLSCLWNDVMAATLKALYETENKTTSIDLSLREEQSCQISSWSDLKWQSLKLFLKRSTTTWVQYEIRLDLKIQQMYSQSKISFPDMCKLDKRTFFCSAASDFSSFLAWLCAHFRSSRVLVSWCSSCLNSSFLSSHNFTNSSNFLHQTWVSEWAVS